MEIIAGSLYFVSNDFFAKVNDPYLKINYESTKRPHYVAFLDNATGLYWLVPCSSKIEKFERLIQKKKEQHKPTDTIKIVKIFDRKTVTTTLRYYIFNTENTEKTDSMIRKALGDTEKTNVKGTSRDLKIITFPNRKKAENLLATKSSAH